MADRLYLSNQADTIFNALKYESKMEKNAWARIAFALSLCKVGKEVSISSDTAGESMRETSFYSEFELLIKSLIRLVYQRMDITEDEFFSSKSIIKNHIDNGSTLIEKLYLQNGKSIDKLLTVLVKEVNFGGRQESYGQIFDLFLGKTVLNKKDLIMELNNNAIHPNSHLAIMGSPGVGKTQFLLKLLTDIRRGSSFQTNFIYFDYKGDVVDNEKFIELSKTQVYRMLQDGQVLPVNPFVLPDYSDQSISLSAREKAESFSSINSKLGAVQKGTLSEVIKSAYENRSDKEIKYPDFNEVYDLAVLYYQMNNKKDDTLIEVLRDLSDFNLFWSHGDDIPPIDKLSNRTLLVDLHKMPVLKELVVYLIIERLYKEMSVLPDSPIQNGRRTIRTILVIDEARNYLSQKNIFLQKIIREGRSKGIVVFFASQSPDDYQQDFFDFQSLLEFAYIFQSRGVSPAAIQDILGCSAKTARDLQVEISHLEPFQAICKGVDKTEEFVKFTAEAFYKSY